MNRARLAGLRVDLALMRPRNRRPERPSVPAGQVTGAELRLAGLRFVWDVVYGVLKVALYAALRIGPKYKRGFLG